MGVVAITGVSGYIGTQLALQLDVDDTVPKIIGIDLKEPAVKPSKLHFVRRSVEEPLDDVFVEHKVEQAVHLAFILDPIHDLEKMRRVNLDGTRNFLAACEKAKTRVVLVVSSATAYGAHADNPLVLYEGAPLRATPDFPYAYHKREQERICYEFAKKNPDVILQIVRPCIVIGPNVGNFISRVLEKPFVFLPRGFDPAFQFVHEDDVTRAIHRLLKMEKVGVFNIAADGAVTMSHLAALSGRRVVRLPETMVRGLVWLFWKLHVKSMAEVPPGFLAFIKYPWLVSNMKLKTELLFMFKHDSQRAFLTFLESRKAAAARDGGAGEPDAGAEED